jgi:acetyl esterase/lipase
MRSSKSATVADRRRTRLRNRRRLVALALCLPVVSALGTARAAAAESTTTCAAGNRGRVLSVEPVARMTADRVSHVLADGGLTGGATYGIAAYREVYCTLSTAHLPTAASGLLVLPVGAHGSVPVVSYDHSTVAKKSDAPSDFDTQEVELVSLYFASDGFAVSAPDYLGLGRSAGLHPFVQAGSEATATIDMLTAAAHTGPERGVRLSRQLFVTGFSQGGHAAMATGQALQESPSPWRVTALAPMAGPYDLDAEFPAILDPDQVDPHRASGYLGYILTAWNRLYHLYDSPTEVFTEPTAGEIGGLFDGTHEIDEISAALPPATELLRPAWQAQIAHPTDRFAAAVEANQVCHWAPRAPVRLYASHGDRDVVFANAQTCSAQIRAKGGHAEIEDMGQVDHVGTALASLPLIRAWFALLTAGRHGLQSMRAGTHHPSRADRHDGSDGPARDRSGRSADPGVAALGPAGCGRGVR